MARVPIWTLAALIFGASPVFAQAERPPRELGLGISGVAGSTQGDFGIPSQPAGADIRVTIPMSARFALEAGTSLGIASTPRWDGVIGYYAIQVKQRIVRGTRKGFHPFVTYGAVGGLEHQRSSPSDYLTPEGQMKHLPGYSFTDISLPILAVVGGGLQQRLGIHAAMRADAQLLTFLWIPLGVRLTAGLSIPLTPYRH